jgi:hypothetical protein
VFAIAGLVFGHYRLGLRRDESEGAGGPVHPGWLGRIGALATVLVVIVGFVTVGSPGRARGRTLDGQRVERLNSLASKIENHVQGQRELPASLDPLYRRASTYESQNFLDPATGQLFEYAVVDSETYRLGTTFATADTLDQYGNSVPLEWRHAAGHVTFTLHARVDGPRRASVSRDGPRRY